MDDLDQSELDKHAVTIQSSFRGYRVRKKRKEQQDFTSLDEEQDEPAASSILGESDADENTLEDGSPEMNEKVIIIQSRYRGYKVRKARKEQKEEKEEKETEKENEEENNEPNDDLEQPSSNVPKVFDPHEEENFFNHHAVVIQSAYRGYVVRKDYLTRKNDPGEDIADGPTGTNELDLNEKAIIIQSSYRGYKARKKYQETKENRQKGSDFDDKGPDPEEEKIGLNKNAVIIQSAYRGYTARKEYDEQKQAKAEKDLSANATVIQSAYRGYQSRKNHATRKANQKRESIEGHSVRIVEFPEDHDEQEAKIIIIQSAYRGYKIRKNMELEKSAESVQGYTRGYNSRKKLVETFYL